MDFKGRGKMTTVKKINFPARQFKGWLIYTDDPPTKNLIHANLEFQGQDYIVEMNDEYFISVMVQLFSQHPGLLKAINDDLGK